MTYSSWYRRHYGSRPTERTFYCTQGSVFDNVRRYMQTDTSNRFIAHRGEVVITQGAWCTSGRATLRSNAGTWQGTRFTPDLTQPCYLFSYGTPALEIDLVQRTLKPMYRYLHPALVEGFGSLGLRLKYVLATSRDPGNWVVKLADGWNRWKEVSTMYEHEGELHCDTSSVVTQSIVSPESTAYVRAVRKRMRSDFTVIDNLRRGGDKEVGAYAWQFMEPYFQMPEHERVRILTDWFAGTEYDDDAYRCLLASHNNEWRYRTYAWSPYGDDYFNTAVKRAANAMRRAKFNEQL
jgi:hypothetical protein